MTSQAHSSIRNRILAAVGAILIVVIALMLFMNINRDRIVEQNSTYLEGSTQQTARRIDDLLTNSLSSIRTAALVFENSLTSPNVDAAAATAMVNTTNFDYLIFTDVNGLSYNDQGASGIATNREYYQRGMEGNAGICAVENASFDEHNVMVFYAPLYFDGDVVGVLSGVYREQTLSDFVTTYFFGEQTTTYLCASDGSIVARSTVFAVHADNAFDIYGGSELNSITLEELERDFAMGISTSFTYKSSSGLGNAYMMKLPSHDWILLRTFPESITDSMVSKATNAGILLVSGVVIAAALFIAVLFVQSRRQQKQLLFERQKATRIIDASTNLFTGLISVDLIGETYEYLKGDCMNGEIAPVGTFQSLYDYWIDTASDQDSSDLKELVSIENIRHELSQDIPYIQFEFRAHRKGELCWLQMAILCLNKDENGTPLGALVAVQDVTQAKEAELAARQALQEAYNAAENASKAKSDFLNSMSHDIRTPMNSIMGLTAIATMYVEDTARVRECLNNISSASKHLLGLINEVLDMAKIESGSISLSEEEFDLPETIENLLTIIHPQIEAKKLDLHVELVDIKHEHVIGDPTRLQQVFVNIMGNSVKFTPEGGSLGLRLKELPSRVSDCGCYEFTFSDTGCGMSEEFLKTVFEPFTRANDSRITKVEGTGLGMAIVKSVVSLMNGSIDVESKLGEGTTFTVTVHLKLRDAMHENLDSLQGLRVLVVDDDEVACKSAAIMLEDIGMVPDYKLSGIAGVEAVKEASENDDPYRAVILDWRMPGMSGIETARKIREVSNHDVPIIIFSGYDWSMIEQEARDVGVDAFISKPLFRARLIQVMKELLSGEKDATVNEKEILENCGFAGRRILLVEDNTMAAAIAEELLELTGADVDHAENGSIAVDTLVESAPHTYDLVLMDIQMPVMNGYEATEAIRGYGMSGRPDLSEIPIIALSADAFSEDIKHAKTVGMNAHISKPLEIDTLVKTLGQWMPKKLGE